MDKLQMVREARHKIERDYVTLCLLDYDERSILTEINIDSYIGRVELIMVKAHVYLNIESIAIAVMNLGLGESIGDTIYEASQIMSHID